MPTPDGEEGRHFRSSGGTAAAGGDGARTRTGPGWRRWQVAAAGVPIALLVALLVGWAVDTAALSGQVIRNVEVDGHDVGGLGAASLPDELDTIGSRLASRPVEITTGDKTYTTTAGALGLSLDDDATTRAALEAGRDDSVIIRPFTWLGSFFSHRNVDLRYRVKASQVEATMTMLQGADLTAPKPPSIQLGPAGWGAVPGIPGKGIDAAGVARALPGAAAATPHGAIVVRTKTVPVAPDYTDADARTLAQRANDITAKGLDLTAAGTTVTVPAATLRNWIGPITTSGKLDLAIKPADVKKALPDLLAKVIVAPTDARFTLKNGAPVVIPSHPGVTCCGADSAEAIWKAMTAGQPSVDLKAETVQPALTTKTAKGLGIKVPVGGNHAWRSGAATTAGPGFTTYYDPGAPRVTNIHRIADLVRGTLVLPGQTFSVNGTVGQRTLAKGFVVAGAISEGEHVDEVGGGVSQFATTTFNAAYFAGLDITESQAHSEWFPRYPRGREATMGFPDPDLKFKNNTPYGILVWTSFTGTSVTVTLYSTPYISADQTGIAESANGTCKVVTTTRTRTYPDGHKTTDTFRATYHSQEGLRC